MRPLAKAAGIAVIIVAVVIVALFVALPFWQSLAIDEFEKSDLSAPSISYDPDIIPWTGSPASTVPPNKDISMRWWVTPVYEDFGGSLNITVENTGQTKVHIYRVGLEWPDHGLVSYKDVDINITARSSSDLGVLVFPAPSNVTEASYIIVLYMTVLRSGGSGWYDYGAVPSGEYQMEILPLGEARSYDVTRNPLRYYERVNSKVDIDEVSFLVASLSEGYQTYDIQQIVAAFDWVRTNIEYVDDPNDNWQTPSITLELGSGDCEDQAMLLASIIDGLGGNARVNLIEGHAFATVYVGSNASVMDDVQDAIISHYGMDLSVFYLEDELGVWLIVDSTSYQYCGGMPTLSVPTGTGQNDFSFEETDWLYAIDTTG